MRSVLVVVSLFTVAAIAALLVFPLPPQLGLMQPRLEEPALDQRLLPQTARGIGQPAWLDQAIRPAESQPAPEEAGISRLVGELQFPVELDADGDPATNPRTGKPVPVTTFSMASGSNGDVRYAVVTLAAAVIPQDAARNPNGTPVEFHVWSDDGSVTLTRGANADTWGAAVAEVVLSDLQFGKVLSYTAHAEGYGELPVRSFTLDPRAVVSGLQIGGARQPAPRSGWSCGDRYQL